MTDYEKKCLTCKHNYKTYGDTPRCNCMCENHDMYEPLTNYDRIKAMNVEEMAEFLAVPCECNVDPERDGYIECGNALCIARLIKWLESTIEEWSMGE